MIDVIETDGIEIIPVKTLDEIVPLVFDLDSMNKNDKNKKVEETKQISSK